MTSLSRTPRLGGTLRLGIVIGFVVLLAKLPLLFAYLGEQDQGRLIVDAVVYVTNGPSTIRNYGILTSPLWTLPLALFFKLFGGAHLVLLTNIGGWLCGGVSTALGFVLLRMLGVGRSWSTAGAVASGLVPATFYMSLYGYPSQYALAILLAAAVAFAQALETKRVAWLVAVGVLLIGLALMKIDFALAGTLLFGVAVLMRRVHDWRTWILPGFAILTFAVAYGVASLAIDSTNLLAFLTRVNSMHPWKTAELAESHTSTVFYACGFGTIAIFATGAVAGLVRRGARGQTVRIVVAWAIAALPVVLFWLARPPMSTRHAVPCALVTVLMAAILADRLVPSRRLAPLLWVVAIVVLNWPFGSAGLDFNYQPSGNLAAGIAVNRRAYAVVETIAKRVADRNESAKVILGYPREDILGEIDFVPAILVEMSKYATAARATNMRWAGAVVFTDGKEKDTKVFIYVPPVRAVNLANMRRVGYYSPWNADLAPLEKRGLAVTTFDANAMFEGRM